MIGDIVHFFDHHQYMVDDLPLPAMVTKTLKNGNVNVIVFTNQGTTYIKENIRLIKEGDDYSRVEPFYVKKR